jgi:hypothetical protein
VSATKTSEISHYNLIKLFAVLTIKSKSHFRYHGKVHRPDWFGQRCIGQRKIFTTPMGNFPFKRMPFGLCNAPALFQRSMDAVLAGLKWSICSVYLNDILTFSPYGHGIEALYLAISESKDKIIFSFEFYDQFCICCSKLARMPKRTWAKVSQRASFSTVPFNVVNLNTQKICN